MTMTFPENAPLDLPQQTIWEKAAEAAQEVLENINAARLTNVALTVTKLQDFLHPLISIATLLPAAEIQEADKFTIAQAIIEFIKTLALNTIWISTMIDDSFDPDARIPWINFSYYGATIGLVLSGFLAAAEMVCHKIINTVNQTSNATILQAPTEDTHLTTSQKTALSIETIAHIGGMGSLMSIISRLIPDNVSPWIRPTLHIVGTGVLGTLGSIAETRTHYNSMLRYNSMFKPVAKLEAVATNGHQDTDFHTPEEEMSRPLMQNGHH
jgi:hypothetical protein